MTQAARHQLSALPSKTRSETTISKRPAAAPETPPLTDDSDESDDEESADKLTMSPAELRVIRRLSARTNVLTVIGHADSLTDAKLEAVKETVRRELAQTDLGFGVFGPANPKSPKQVMTTTNSNDVETPSPETPNGSGGGSSATTPKINSHGRVSFGQDGQQVFGDEDEDEEDEATTERRPRPVIKLRSGRGSTSIRRSRSRTRIQDAFEPASPDPTDSESVPNVRFSAHIIANDLSKLLPFAVIAPEQFRKRSALKRVVQEPSTASSYAGGGHQGESSAGTEDGVTSPSTENGSTPVSPNLNGRTVRNVPLPYLGGPPEDLKGVFVRKYRWGTIDVLEPSHCDFAALRTAVLSTHLRVLKSHTKEVLYEKYRTEKLLARRATRNIGESETKKMFDELGL